MATLDYRLLLKSLRRTLGTDVVVRIINNKVIVSKYPDMRNIVPTEAQKRQRALFAEAQAYARRVMADANLVKPYCDLLPPGKRLFNFIASEYQKRNTASRPVDIEKRFTVYE